MHVDDHGVGDLTQRTGVELMVDSAERVVEGVHEDAAEQVDHQDAPPALGFEQLSTPAGYRGEMRIVERPDHPRLTLDIGQGLLLVPGMVAQGEAVRAGLEKLARC